MKKTGCFKLLHFLFVGNEDAASSRCSLAENGISRVLCCDENSQIFPHPNIVTRRIPINDAPVITSGPAFFHSTERPTNLYDVLPQCFDFLGEYGAPKQTEKTLIYSNW